MGNKICLNRSRIATHDRTNHNILTRYERLARVSHTTPRKQIISPGTVYPKQSSAVLCGSGRGCFKFAFIIACKIPGWEAVNKSTSEHAYFMYYGVIDS